MHIAIEAPLSWGVNADMGTIDPAFAGRGFWAPIGPHHNVPARIPGYVIRPDIRRWVLHAIESSVTGKGRVNLLFSGPRGSGKSTGPEQLFAALGIPVDRKNAGPSTIAAELVAVQSYNQAQGHHLVPGPMFRAITKGYPFILNEAFLMDPGELMELADLVERGIFTLPNGDEIEAAPGFVLILTDNTNGNGDLTGRHPGVQTQNAALLDRVVVLKVGYMDESDELRAALGPYGDDDIVVAEATPIAKRVIQFANSVRKSSVMGGQFSTRQVIEICKDVIAFSPLSDAGVDPFEFVLEGRVLGKLSDEERQATHRLLQGLAT